MSPLLCHVSLEGVMECKPCLNGALKWSCFILRQWPHDKLHLEVRRRERA